MKCSFFSKILAKTSHSSPVRASCGVSFVSSYTPNLNIKRTLVGNEIVWSLRWSWIIACRRHSNYIFILDLTLDFNGLGRDNCKTRRETSTAACRYIGKGARNNKLQLNLNATVLRLQRTRSEKLPVIWAFIILLRPQYVNTFQSIINKDVTRMFVLFGENWSCYNGIALH